MLTRLAILRGAAAMAALLLSACSDGPAEPGSPNPAAATHLVFVDAPTRTIPAGVVLVPALQIAAVNEAGATDTTFSGRVTITLDAGGSPAALTGTRTVSAVRGVATFGSLNIATAGRGYAFKAAAPSLQSVTSAHFDALFAPHLVFTAQPGDYFPGGSLGAVRVTAVDSLGQRDPSYTGPITLAAHGTPGAVTLAGTPTRPAVAGEAIFDDLTIAQRGLGSRLTATAPGYLDGVSDQFGSRGGLVFLVEPSAATTLTPISPSVQVRAIDGLGLPDPRARGAVRLTLTTGPSGAVLFSAVEDLVGGVATFSGLAVGAPGSGLVLTATDPSSALGSVSSVPFDVTPGVWMVAGTGGVNADGAQSTSANGRLYIMGGYDMDFGTPVRGVVEFDPATGAFTAKASMPTARRAFGVASLGGKIYVAGGFDPNGNPLGSVESFNPGTNTWTPVAPMPSIEGEVALATVGSTLYAIAPFATLAYDAGTNAWTARRAMPNPHTGLRAGVANGIIHVLGNGAQPSFEAYDPSTDTWGARTPLAVPLYFPGVATVGSTLYAFGNHAVEAYDPVADAWHEALPALDLALPTATELDGVLYVAGTIALNNCWCPILIAYRP